MYNARLKNEYIRTDKTEYGGNQELFDGVIMHGGCGLIAAADMLRYISGQYGFIAMSDYRKYIEKLSASLYPFAFGGLLRYILTKGIISRISKGTGTWGIMPHRFMCGVKKYTGNAIGLKFIKTGSKKLLDSVAQSLENDIPVPLKIGLWGKVYLYTDAQLRVLPRCSYGYHWVNITALDSINGKVRLTVSTWGEKRYIDYKNLCESHGLFSGAVIVKKL